jgi:hypothetical protein
VRARGRGAAPRGAASARDAAAPGSTAAARDAAAPRGTTLTTAALVAAAFSLSAGLVHFVYMPEHW